MVKIAVTFELGAECLLTVTARELATNRAVRATLSARERPSKALAAGAAHDPGQHLVTGVHRLVTPPPAKKPGRRGVRAMLERLLGR